ncbi:MAG: sigma-54-dependent Fis family transcriptional regulator [Deltaproteobacteria bacterium]|nr:sigma-54-dependent Fis family transcriptional regulator [Deltaproteobacteria bacterium]
MTGSIIIVDDDEDTRSLLCEALRRRGYQVEAVDSAKACLERLRTATVDVVVTDVQMPGMSGVELCTVLHERHSDLLPIVLTGIGALDTAVAAIRAGAYDFITKPVRIEALEVAVRRALEHLSVKQEVKRLRAAVDRDHPIPGMIGTSSALRVTTEMIRQVADSDAMVLITGESGTGKELVARSLHDLSARRGEPFVAINCGAMPAPLLESELFGHVRGAFTDAKNSRGGLFLQAGKGTIFLDELGEMPLEMQVKLLRVLQERTVRPVGGDTEIPFEARVVTATNRDLDVEVAEKRFREDLYYRINVVAIAVPPLRDRGGDVLVLANHVLSRIAARTHKPVVQIGAEAARKLMDYDWPGNVRELENCVERAVAMCDGKEIAASNLPTKVQKFQSARLGMTTDTPTAMIPLDEMERRYVRQVLGTVNGNKTHAARVLGIDRRSLYRRLETPAPAPEAATQAASAGRS